MQSRLLIVWKAGTLGYGGPLQLDEYFKDLREGGYESRDHIEFTWCRIYNAGGQSTCNSLDKFGLCWEGWMESATLLHHISQWICAMQSIQFTRSLSTSLNIRSLQCGCWKELKEPLQQHLCIAMLAWVWLQAHMEVQSLPAAKTR